MSVQKIIALSGCRFHLMLTWFDDGVSMMS